MGAASCMPNRLRRPLLAVLAASAFAPAAVRAAEASPRGPLTLAEALDFAQTHYPAVRAALAQKTAADRDIDVARAAYLPQVNLLYQINRATLNNITGTLLPQSVIPAQSGPVLPASGQSAWNSGVGALVSWRPFDFGYRAAKVDAAKAADAAAAQAVSLSQLDVQSAAADAFLNLAAAETLASVAQANVDRLHAFGRAVHALVDNTLRPGVDAQQADAADGLAQTALISARANVEEQRAILATLVDRPAEGLIITAAQMRALPPDATEGPAAKAGDHPAAQAAAARVRQQSAELAAVSSQYAPQFDVLGSAYARGSGKTAAGVYSGGGLGPDVGNWAVGVQLTLPLGSYPVLRAQEAGQRARVEAEQARYRQTLDELDQRLARAKIGLQSARAIAAITPTALEAARQTEAQQRARFQSGLSTVVDVTTAEAALAQAESQDAIARLNVWRALGALSAAQGTMAPLRRLLGPE